MKRPAQAAASQAVAKKPATHKSEEPKSELTEEALNSHKSFMKEMEEKCNKGNMDQETFDKALQHVDPQVSQALWKCFEQNRKASGQDELYKKECNGTGSTKKRRQLLRAWIMDKGSCGSFYRESTQTLGMVQEAGIKEKWLTLEEAQNKWGKAELNSRLQSGTIEGRRCPNDRRFWEFKAVQQHASKKVTLTKGTTYKTGEEKVKKDQLLEVDNLKFENLQEADFEMGVSEEEESEGGLPEDLQKTLGLKNEKAGKADGSKANPNVWENESKVSASTSTAELQEKLLKFKAEITKDVAQLEMKAMEVKKTCPNPALEKKLKKAIEDGPGLCDKVTKLLRGKGKLKMEVAKPQLQSALQLLTQVKALKAQVAKHQKASQPKKK
eukprot:Skav236180  [mRNA]  locus=scaffold3799:65667:66815:+ [translate_table: standard]